MLCVAFIVYDWYDNMLLCRHEASFDGAIFNTLEEIREWESLELSNGRGKVTRVVDLRTAKQVPYESMA